MHDTAASGALGRVPAQLLPPLAVLRTYPAHDYTLAGAFESRLSLRADQPFYVYEGRIRTWREFEGDVALESWVNETCGRVS